MGSLISESGEAIFPGTRLSNLPTEKAHLVICLWSGAALDSPGFFVNKGSPNIPNGSEQETLVTTNCRLTN